VAETFGQGDNGAYATVTSADIAALDSFAAANGLPMPTIDAVPEPAYTAIFAAGSLAIWARRRRAH
jgi:hypothetical protein